MHAFGDSPVQPCWESRSFTCIYRLDVQENPQLGFVSSTFVFQGSQDALFSSKRPIVFLGFKVLSQVEWNRSCRRNHTKPGTKCALTNLDFKRLQHCLPLFSDPFLRTTCVDCVKSFECYPICIYKILIYLFCFIFFAWRSPWRLGKTSFIIWKSLQFSKCGVRSSSYVKYY